MKSFQRILVVFMVLGTINTLQSQSDSKCKVVNEDTPGKYEGKCKKGLAHGLGIYKFSDNIKIYEGQFKKGKFNGLGVIYSIESGKKEVLKEGIWKNNIYKGEKKIASYIVKRNYNVDRYTLRRKGDQNKVWLNFIQNGTRNNVSNLNISVSNGVEMPGGYVTGYNIIEFPFTCSIIYTTMNKLQTASGEATFEFIINEPGEWDVILYN